jgi:hypothetical protein
VCGLKISVWLICLSVGLYTNESVSLLSTSRLKEEKRRNSLCEREKVEGNGKMKKIYSEMDKGKVEGKNSMTSS